MTVLMETDVNFMNMYKSYYSALINLWKEVGTVNPMPGAVLGINSPTPQLCNWPGKPLLFSYWCGVDGDVTIKP